MLITAGILLGLSVVLNAALARALIRETHEKMSAVGRAEVAEACSSRYEEGYSQAVAELRQVVAEVEVLRKDKLNAWGIPDKI